MKLVTWDELTDWSQGDSRALISRLGGVSTARQINADQLAFRVSKLATETGVGEFVLEEPIKPLFDHTGRRIPAPGMKTVDENRGFHLIQLKIDYAERLARFEAAFQRKLGVTAIEFEVRIGAVMGRLATDQMTASLVMERVCLPIVIPQMEISGQRDYGMALEQDFLSAAGRAYTQQSPGRTFTNHRKGDLAGKVKVVAASHERLVDAIYRDPVVALYFPNALQGFSIQADRDQMSGLSEDFLLAGAIDTASALAGYPDVLARDWNTSGLDCAAVQWRSRGYSLHFRAYDDRLYFGCGSLGAGDYYSGGLLVLG